MTMQISAYGRLGKDPKAIQTQSGKAMTTASLAVTLDCREDGETFEGTQWLNLLAEAREAFGNLPARKQVPGVGEMYFPEVLPSPHTGRDEQEPEAEDPEGPVIRDKDARRVLV